ncbi:dTDP-4-dehydrorhamnose 3,5-epimerase [Danxiaibacter flavus]|uniref:dTDP-4-dehydrorhamnose 3,5-epimerase n=1 Tax=Danxiaibacter flavus TaxID=3049108 RepID=A0ABV3ZEX5_9BACT|nr:dTDP-4-dehydrorhamnose 3,5-epimerase [Chitinophagaceae bacterium DXS]
MRIEKTILEGCFIIHDTIFKDNRGYFFESFNKKKFEELTGQEIDFVQDNQSHSTRGTLRGLHFQKGNYAQAKLVRVLSGKVLDVAVDIRPDSKTFGQYVAVELSETSGTQFFVPRGFAHGFVVLSAQATFFYKCDNYYNKASEGGIIYNDKDLNIDWSIADNELILSEKDLQLPSFVETTSSILDFANNLI